MEKIFVLMGGCSSEREISLLSGRNIAEGLRSVGKYEVVEIDLKEESLDGVNLAGASKVYIALHGGWGESGGVQKALDRLGIPYTGPGAKASQIAMDKIATKRILDAHSIPTAPWATVAADAPVCPLALPAVVKPPCDGSSVGITKVSHPEEWRGALEAAAKAMSSNGGEILVEAFIPGREMTVGVVGGEALPAIEIVTPNGWYGYDEKYNSDETRYTFVDEEEAKRLNLSGIAIAACDAIGCRGVTRVDFRVTPEGKVYVLELNTSPGFTSHSLVPKAGMKTGLSFGQVCDLILSKASCDHE